MAGAALYMRLSKEDGGGESASIQNQRALLRGFADAKGFGIFAEYIDDGYSGTDFARPAFKKLLEDIEGGLVNTLIVKDLSRLGRDYLMTGHYTEIWFPAHGVRFVAVNDGYDSALFPDDMVPFRNLLNEMAARDISRKIRSALRTKMEQGDFIGNFPPYGYKKDPLNRSRLLPDGAAAMVVRKIFELAAAGMSRRAIAAWLTAEGEPTPLQRRGASRGEMERGGKEWGASTVSKILSCEAYLGKMVQGKTKKLSFRKGAPRAMPKSEWILAEHTHEAIVSGELFLSVPRRNRA